MAEIIVPIPICRITTNIAPKRKYRSKNQHWPIDLSDKYNTVDFYIAGRDYNFREMAKKFPMLLNFLFPITTIDFLIYGTGIAAEPIMNKMFENKEPIVALQSTTVGDYQFFCRTYQLSKTDAFIMYAKEEYSKLNYIEFFNNIDYLNLLATTNIAYELNEPYKTTPLKAVYEYDLENLKQIGVRDAIIRKLRKRFLKKKKFYEKLKKFRSGVIIGS